MRYLLIAALTLMMCSTLGADFLNGTTTCPTSGAKQVSATSYNLYQLTVVTGLSNGGSIAIGGSTVTTSNAPLMSAGSSFNWTKPSAGVNPATLYFACTLNTDSIQWVGSR